MTKAFDVDNFEHRLEITRLRVTVIHHTITLALATTAIPIVLAGLFDVHKLGGCFWTVTLVGWLALGLSMSSGVVFLSQVPRWARDRARDIITDGTYLICVASFLIGVILLGYAGYLTISTAPLKT